MSSHARANRIAFIGAGELRASAVGTAVAARSAASTAQRVFNDGDEEPTRTPYPSNTLSQLAHLLCHRYSTVQCLMHSKQERTALQIPLGPNAPPPHVTIGQHVMKNLEGENVGSSGQHDPFLDNLRSRMPPTTKI